MSWPGPDPAGSTPAQAGIGLDATSVSRWHGRLLRSPAVQQVAFTAAERDWAARCPVRYALLWAAKEGVVKTVHQGFDGISWCDVEVDGERGTARLAGDPTSWRVWWSVQGDYAIALVCDRGLARRVAVTSCLIDDRSGYPQRSAGVRALAERTLRCFTPARDVLWACSGFGAPVLVADGAQVAVSLTHGDGLLGAAIALQPSWMHRTSQSSGLYSAQSIS